MADSSKAKITRIKAQDDALKKSTTAKSAAVSSKKVTKSSKVVKKQGETPAKKKNIFARIGAYFAGAWKELRQVRWPNRKATWALTGAVIVFSVFFMLLITLLDTFFKFLFELIIK